MQAATTTGTLSDVELAVLDLERTWSPRVGPKEEAIREQLAMAPSHYYRLLDALLDEPAALAHDPLVVRRLRRTRAARRRLRSQVGSTTDRG